MNYNDLVRRVFQKPFSIRVSSMGSPQTLTLEILVDLAVAPSRNILQRVKSPYHSAPCILVCIATQLTIAKSWKMPSVSLVTHCNYETLDNVYNYFLLVERDENFSSLFFQNQCLHPVLCTTFVRTICSVSIIANVLPTCFETLILLSLIKSNKNKN